jgi:bifunctional NMN adenylyltransferase/nudix hydrolase
VKKASTIGVVVGRFQVDELHVGHQFLINKVRERHNRVLIVLGVGPLPTTCRNPLPFETRKALIQEVYPDVEVIPMVEHPSDHIWSLMLDDEIKEFVKAFYGPEYYNVQLYCSRDGMVDYYTGELPIEQLQSADIGVSATLRRELIAQTPGHTSEFARGVIWANHNRFPTVYSVVDMAVLRDNTGVLSNERISDELLVITKDHLSGFMLPGGFCDVGSGSHEHDASREVLEETGLVVRPDNWKYLRSMRITDDWRYRFEVDEMRTSLFFTHRFEGKLAAGDDAATAEFVPVDSLDVSDFNKTHRPLAETVLDYVANHFG